MSGGYLSGGICPVGICPVGICPDTSNNTWRQWKSISCWLEWHTDVEFIFIASFPLQKFQRLEQSFSSCVTSLPGGRFNFPRASQWYSDLLLWSALQNDSKFDFAKLMTEKRSSALMKVKKYQFQQVISKNSP